MKNKVKNQKMKGPAYDCPSGASEVERHVDVCYPQSHEYEIAQLSDWPWLVEDVHAGGYEDDQTDHRV